MATKQFGIAKETVWELRGMVNPPIDVIKGILISTMILFHQDLSDMRYDLQDGRAWRYCKALLRDVNFLVERSQAVSKDPDGIPHQVRHVAWCFLQSASAKRMSVVS